MSQPKHIARKRFGQNFLVDGAIIDNIVRAIAPQAGQPMVEIGPGLMALTQPLLERLGQLTVIELDRDLATRLRGRQGLNVVESDVLKVDFTALAHTLGAPKTARRGQSAVQHFQPHLCSTCSTMSMRCKTSTSCYKKR